MGRVLEGQLALGVELNCGRVRAGIIMPSWAQTRKQPSAGSIVPMNQGSLQPGTMISVTSHQFGPRPDHFRLTAVADLPDQGRTVTIPLRFSKQDAEQCVNAMTQWLRTHP